jgi:putative toxin-antitoxin system antitoxin component (TIGR02293 family)
MHVLSDVEDIAAQLRNKLRIDDQLAPEMLDTLHRSAKILRFRIKAEPNRELADTGSEVDLYRRTISIRREVMDAAGRGDARARMTLAHELGHFAIGQLSMARRGHSASASRPPDSLEMQADRFASLFLVPTHLARKFETAEQISEQFNVSLEVARRRFQEVKAPPRQSVAQNIFNKLGGSKVLNDEVTSEADFARIVSRRLPLKVLSNLRRSGFSSQEIRSLIIPAHTQRQRAAKKQPLTVDESDRLVRLTRIQSIAEDVFADPVKANRWLRQSLGILGDKPPLKIAQTDAGARVVEQILAKIDWGAAA